MTAGRLGLIQRRLPGGGNGQADLHVFLVFVQARAAPPDGKMNYFAVSLLNVMFC